MSAKMTAQFSQAFTDGWSKSDTKTTSSTTNSSVTVTLPPYVIVLINQGESNTTVTTNYNCPVFLAFKVTIYINNLYGGIVTYTHTFGASNSNARKDLYHRAFEEGSKEYDSEKVDWVTILADSDFKDAITKITNNIPMSGTGATISYTNKTTYSEVDGKAAMYPLTSVKLGSPNVDFIDENNTANMKVGQYSYVDFLPLSGYNTYGAEYYGFNKKKGHWVVVDANMREISGSDAPVILEKEATTGNTKYIASNPGTCYLKYVIDENVYPTGIGANTYTKNSDITTALLAVNVEDEEVTFKITGNYMGIVNSPLASLEGNKKLTVSVYDNTGKEIEYPYIWDQRELKHIKLMTDGRVSFDRPGTCGVRVMPHDRTKYSAWKDITAVGLKAVGFSDDFTAPEYDIERTQEADNNTTFMITGSYAGKLSSDAESIEGDGKLHVSTLHSTGKELPVAYTWEAREGSEGMTLTPDGYVSFTRTGTYYVRVKNGQYHSEWVEIDAHNEPPARILHAPTASGNTYTGESVDLLAGDGKCEGGTMIYALGSDNVTAPTHFTSEQPKAVEAGTYYVWYKVTGNTNHRSTNPECVIATIEENSGAEPETETETDEGNTGVSSSGSGCNGGISLLGLSLILSAIISRKTR